MLHEDFALCLRIAKTNNDFFNEDHFIKDFVRGVGAFIGSREEAIKFYSQEGFNDRLNKELFYIYKDEKGNNIYASKWVVNELGLKYNQCGTRTWSV